VFRKDGDFAAFIKLLREAGERIDMRLLAFCLMPNHFHLVPWPRNDGDLSAYMMWLTTAHVRRYHQHYHSSGHVWQGRFRSYPIQEDFHLLGVHRYVERNALRAGLVERAQDWLWCSAAPWRQGLPLLTPSPVPCLLDWLGLCQRAADGSGVGLLAGMHPSPPALWRRGLGGADGLGNGSGGQLASARPAAEEAGRAANAVRLSGMEKYPVPLSPFPAQLYKGLFASQFQGWVLTNRDMHDHELACTHLPRPIRATHESPFAPASAFADPSLPYYAETA
jgi:REP element-mobilizing transposase RayT